MTLALSMITTRFVMQVTDRLVTVDGQPYDQESNKNIIYVAKNAVVTIGYSGLAYLGSITTDEWIVRTLLGEDPACQNEETRRALRLRGNGRKTIDIGCAIYRVLKKSQEALEKETVPEKSKSLQIIFAGWQGRRRGGRIVCRPITYVVCIEQNKGRIKSSTTTLERYWHYNDVVKSKQGIQNPFHVFQVPFATTKNLIQKLAPAAHNPNKSRQILIDEIQSRAANEPTIGKDCMCIYIPIASQQIVEATYIAKDIKPEITSMDEMYSVAFSPWIIGPQILSPPMIIMGPMTQIIESNIGKFEVCVQAPTQQPKPIGSGPRLISYFSGQRRPLKPK